MSLPPEEKANLTEVLAKINERIEKIKGIIELLAQTLSENPQTS